MLAFLAFLSLLAGCRQAEQVAGPVIRATAMPTPRSTPLPPVPTVIAPGVEENPIRMVLVPADSEALRDTDDNGLDALARFEAAVLEESGLIVDVVPVERPAEALAALCDSMPGRVTVAWLDGVAYRAAVARNCGTPELLVERGRPRSNAAVPVVLVAERSLGLSRVGQIVGRSFCRLGVQDAESWLAPALAMRAAGVDPVAALTDVRDYADYDDLLDALVAGECDAASMTENRFERLRDSVRDELAVIGRTAPLPYGVLMYPVSLPLGERLRLTDALLALAFDAERSSLLDPLLMQENLARVAPGDLEELTAFLDSTGLDFAQLGN